MTRRRACRTLSSIAVVMVVLFGAPRASAQPFGFLEAPEHVKNARRDERYAFCSKPKAPLSHRQRALCPMADSIEGCEAFAATCKGEQQRREPPDTDKKPEHASQRTDNSPVLEALGELAKGLVWLLVALVLLAVALPLIRAFLAARRDKSVADKPVENVASPTAKAPAPEPEAISDAEAALREADAHAQRGELGRALSLYLAASLAALDRRGAIRLARHRTNGEYVRACADNAAKEPLREIVRAVDKVEFGNVPPTANGVAHVASRASDLVRSSGASRSAASMTTTMLSVLLLAFVLPLAGCSGSTGGGTKHDTRTVDDPAGDELPIDVLQRSGYTVNYLDSSLAALPIPAEHESAPVVGIDLDRVLLEEETVGHLLHWVDEGGVLVLFGAPASWPKELGVEQVPGESGSLDVISSEIFAREAHIAIPRAMRWPDSEPIAWIGKSVYGAHLTRGKGTIVGMAGTELFTNIGVARPDNAAVFVALFDIAMLDRRADDARRGVPSLPHSFELRIARVQDGIPPAGNPISSLTQAGLGKGLVHALVAALVLFLAFGIRHARPRPVAAPARRAFAEHVEATGAFYGRARALGHALASYGRYAEMRLRERVSRGADPAQFLAARAQVPLEDAERVWKRATEASADDPPRGDELATIRDLGAMLAKALETS